jgi:hypothetical protein
MDRITGFFAALMYSSVKSTAAQNGKTTKEIGEKYE